MERMVVDLRPSLKQTFAPVGVSCRTLTIATPQRSDTFNETDKAALLLPINDEITELQDWAVLITELDLERGTCKARLASDPDEKRINAVITDPLLKQLNNPYSLAMAAGNRCRSALKRTSKMAQSDACTSQTLASNNSFKPNFSCFRRSVA